MALLDDWADIDARERALGIESGTPILIDPQSRVDPRLARFLTRSRFAFLAEESQCAYVKDYRLFFTFLWKRGRYWDEADHDDIDNYETWRRRSPDNPSRIGVNGHEVLRAGGHLISGQADMKTPDRRTQVLRTINQDNGTTPLPAIASASR